MEILQGLVRGAAAIRADGGTGFRADPDPARAMARPRGDRASDPRRAWPRALQGCRSCDPVLPRAPVLGATRQRRVHPVGGASIRHERGDLPHAPLRRAGDRRRLLATEPGVAEGPCRCPDTWRKVRRPCSQDSLRGSAAERHWRWNTWMTPGPPGWKIASQTSNDACAAASDARAWRPP